MISQIKYTPFGGPRYIRECVRTTKAPLYDSARPSSISVRRIEAGDTAGIFSFSLGRKNVFTLKGFEVRQISADVISSSSAQCALQFYVKNYPAIAGLGPLGRNIFSGLYRTYDTVENLKRSASFFDEDADTLRVLLISLGVREIDLDSPATKAVFEHFSLAVPEAKSFHDFGAVIQMLRMFPDGACLNDVMFLPFELICAAPKQ